MHLRLLILGFCMIVTGACSSEINSPARSQDFWAEATPIPDPDPEPTVYTIPDALLNASPAQLCSRLAEIKIIPTRNPMPTDPIYEAIVAKSDEAVPCLVDQIPNKTKVRDPRYSVPVWQHYAVGDTAIFILLRILRDDALEREKLLIEMLPPASKKEWETNGIYAYFNYVSEPKNRKQLQEWWKNWLKTNKT